MTVSSETRVSRHAGTSTDATLTVGFSFVDADDIEIWQRDGQPSPSVDTLLTRGVHYSVNTANQEVDVTDGASDFIEDRHDWIIVGKEPIVQLTDLIEGGAIPADSLEVQLDRLTRMLGDVSERVETKCIRFPDADDRTLNNVLSNETSRPLKVTSFLSDGGVTEGDPGTDTVIETLTAKVNGGYNDADGEHWSVGGPLTPRLHTDTPSGSTNPTGVRSGSQWVNTLGFLRFASRDPVGSGNIVFHPSHGVNRLLTGSDQAFDVYDSSNAIGLRLHGAASPDSGDKVDGSIYKGSGATAGWMFLRSNGEDVSLTGGHNKSGSGEAWWQIDADGMGGPRIFSGLLASAPSNRAAGSLWLDTNGGLQTRFYSVEQAAVRDFSLSEVAESTRPNLFINADFGVNQRGNNFTSGSSPTVNNDNNYMSDRWVYFASANDLVDVSFGVGVGVRGVADFTTTAAGSSNNKWALGQCLDQKDSLSTRGKTLTLGITHFSTGATMRLGWVVLSWSGSVGLHGTALDHPVSSWNASNSTPTWDTTGDWEVVDEGVVSGALGATAREVVTLSSLVPTDCNHLMVIFFQYNSGYGSSELLRLSKPKLEVGTYPTNLELERPIGLEFRACQRFFEAVNADQSAGGNAIYYGLQGVAISNNTAYFHYPLQARKRSDGAYDVTGVGTGQVVEVSSGTATAASVVSPVDRQLDAMTLGVGVAGTPLTAGESMTYGASGGAARTKFIYIDDEIEFS